MTQMVGVGMVAVNCVCVYCSITSLNSDLVYHLFAVSSYCFIHGYIISWYHSWVYYLSNCITSLYLPWVYHLICIFMEVSFYCIIKCISSLCCVIYGYVISQLFHLIVSSMGISSNSIASLYQPLAYHGISSPSIDSMMLRYCN